MQLEERKDSDVLIVTVLEKRLDAPLAPDFKAKMVEYISKGNNRIVLDMSEVDFVDSSGLGVMVSILKELGGNDNFAICNIAEPIMKMFKIARMDRVFNILEGAPEAVANLTN